VFYDKEIFVEILVYFLVLSLYASFGVVCFFADKKRKYREIEAFGEYFADGDPETK
jgi:hypothetical protein